MYTVKVTHVIKSGQMSRKDAEALKAGALKRMQKPSATSKISKAIKKYLPASMSAKEVVAQKQEEIKNTVEVVPEGRDKFSVCMRNTVRAFDGYTQEEAAAIQSKLQESLGKLEGKGSKLEIEVVEC